MRKPGDLEGRLSFPKEHLVLNELLELIKDSYTYLANDKEQLFVHEKYSNIFCKFL